MTAQSTSPNAKMEPPRVASSLSAHRAQQKSVFSLTLALVWTCFCCDYILMTMQIPLFPLLGLSPVRTGVLFACKALTQIVTSPFTSSVIDKFDKKLLLGFGLSVEIVSISMFMWNQSFYLWAAARALSGVSASFILSAGMAELNAFYRDSPDVRATAMSLATTGIVAGVCGGPVFGGALYELWEPLPYLVLIGIEVCVGVNVLGVHVKEKRRKLQLVQQLGPGGGGEYHEIIGPSGVAEGPAEGRSTRGGASGDGGSRSDDVEGPASASAAADSVSALTILAAPVALWPLLAVAFANAVIAGLESTSARYFAATFGMSPGEVGAFYMSTSVPSCICVGCGAQIAATLYSCCALIQPILSLILGVSGLFCCAVTSKSSLYFPRASYPLP